MVRREKKQRIDATVVKTLGKMKGKDKRSAAVKKLEETRSSFRAAPSTVSYSQGATEEERSERYLSYSSRPEVAEARTRPELQARGLRTRSERSPPVHDYSLRREPRPRVRSDGGGTTALPFRTMSSQQRQTFLGPLEFFILPVEPSLMDPSSGPFFDSAEARASQEREAILGPIEFPSPESTFSEDSDWMGRISSIVNATKASENINKHDNPVQVTSNSAPADADWSPTSLPATDMHDMNHIRAGSTGAGSSINLSFDIFKFVFSGCYPVPREPKVPRTNLAPELLTTPCKNEHPLTDLKREQAWGGLLDFNWLFPSAGSDLSYNGTDLDDNTLVTREALTLQTTLLSSFTGTNLSETVVDDGSQPSTFEALQLKLHRMGVSVQQGLDKLTETALPKSSPPITTETLVSPDFSRRLNNLPAAMGIPISSPPPPIITAAVTPTRDWSSRLDRLPAAKAMPLSSSLPRTSAIPMTKDWSASLAANTSRAHFAGSVGNAIRRRDMDASKLQIEINRLRAKIESAKLKVQEEQSEVMGGACNSALQDNRIRSAPLPLGAAAATATNDSSKLHLDQNNRSQSVMIRVPCDWLEQ
jgi:hypothetical protein